MLYALGGGLGHVVRAASLAHELAALGAQVCALVPAGRAALAHALAPGSAVRELLETRSAVALGARVRHELAELSADELIVDALPSGVLGELDAIGAEIPTTLLLRLLRPGIIDPSRWRGRPIRVVYLESNLGWLPCEHGAEPFGPVAREPQVRVEAAPDVLVVASEDRLVPVLAKLARRLEAEGLEVWLSRPGAIGRLGETPRTERLLDLGRVRPRVLIGPAGYNLSYEAIRAGVPHLALPLPRRFDDQHRRACAVAEVPPTLDALERRALELARGAPSRARTAAVSGHRALAQLLSGPSASGSRRSEAPSARFSDKTMSQR